MGQVEELGGDVGQVEDLGGDVAGTAPTIV